ncbi:MAG: fumarate hydratase [Clostridia bacterium]|nr:fumarate hydratase [Clostridia bacterium]
MRELSCDVIQAAVRSAFIEANICLPRDLAERIDECAAAETVPVARTMFGDMKKNLAAAEELQIPICQDCGMAVVFAEVGQELHITGGGFEEAINEGVRQAYSAGYLRKSVVSDPLRRENTGDNTPAVIHTRIVPGDTLRLCCAPKGFGSENMSSLKMFNPTASADDIAAFVIDCVRIADARPCPPVVVGVGIGGDFEYAAQLAKKALCREVDRRHPDPFYADLEKKILRGINALGIGPQGFSGDITALAVNIETYPTHIAGLPVGVNVGCHVTRHKTVVL